MAIQPTIQQIATNNKTAGRCSTIQAIVLHEADTKLEYLDGDARWDYPSVRVHESYHYAIEQCKIHQYVADADTSWSFNPTDAFPTWAISAANAGIDPNCYTLNIGVVTGVIGSTPYNPRPDNVYTEEMKLCLAKLLAWLAAQNNLTLTTDTVWRHDAELIDLPLADIIAVAIPLITAQPPTGGGGGGGAATVLDCNGNTATQAASCADMQAAQADILALQTDVTQAQTDILALQTDVTQAQADIAQLQADVVALGTPSNTLTLTNGDLTSTVNGIPATVSIRGDALADAFGTTLGYLLPA